MTLVDGTSHPTVIDSMGKYYTTTFFPGGLLIAKGNSVDVYVKGDISGSTAANRTADFDIDKVTDVILRWSDLRLRCCSFGNIHAVVQRSRLHDQSGFGNDDQQGDGSSGSKHCSQYFKPGSWRFQN